jgi:hypothetical protein
MIIWWQSISHQRYFEYDERSSEEKKEKRAKIYYFMFLVFYEKNLIILMLVEKKISMKILSDYFHLHGSLVLG